LREIYQGASHVGHLSVPGGETNGLICTASTPAKCKLIVYCSCEPRHGSQNYSRSTNINRTAVYSAALLAET